MKSVREIVPCLIWPTLMGLCVGLTIYGFSLGKPVITFNLIYLSLALTLLVLERLMPHERAWLRADGQTFANIAHTLLSKGVVQGLIIFGGVIGITSMITELDQPGYSFWPRGWPLFLQVFLGLVAAEFGLYWAHRLAHTWYPLWRFHAIHHSVTRLWVINTGRFHFVDSVFSIVLGISILLVLGAPLEVITWLSALTAYIGLLTHCNIEMRFGPISWVFNTPGLHRWHHSRNLEEGNRNFCENLMIWDQVFGTYINPSRRPPVDIGVEEDIPASFVKQLAWPFKTFREEKA